MKQHIFPSIMAKNQQELDGLLKKLKGVAKILHLDIVDGKFAPNHSVDFAYHLSPNFRYQAHLMIKNPELWIYKNRRHIDIFIPQFEAIESPSTYITWMKELHKPVAFAIKPETKVKILQPYLSAIDTILVLTVHPGFYGSKYLPAELTKISQIKKINPHIKAIVDGGMNPKTIPQATKAGADFFVSGSYITTSTHPQKAMKELEQALQ